MDESGGAGGPEDPPLDTIALQVDEQAHKLIELKQKFTYFLVTAAIAIIAFSGKFLLDYGKLHPRALALTGAVTCLLGAATAALLSSALALFSVYKGHQSYGIHVAARNRRETKLSDADEKKAEGANNAQSTLLIISMSLLVVEIVLSISFFILALS